MKKGCSLGMSRRPSWEGLLTWRRSAVVREAGETKSAERIT